jgi:hypothetical protein
MQLVLAVIANACAIPCQGKKLCLTTNARNSVQRPPFEDMSIWDAYWSRPGTFKLQLLRKPEQLQQILQHFADAKSRQNQGENAKVSYRFPLIELARYFGVHVETFRPNILRSKEYQELCSALALLKQPQVQQPNN